MNDLYIILYLKYEKPYFSSSYSIPDFILPDSTEPGSVSYCKGREWQKRYCLSAHPLASEAGIAILQKGGNAVDAAIAVQFALAVVYPQAGNLGERGFLVVRFSDGRHLALDFRETAPAAATRDMFLDTAGNPVPWLSLKGPLASGVPGTVDGIFASLCFARLPLKELIAPAIDLAQKGFRITDREAVSLNLNRENFLRYNKYPVAFVKMYHGKKETFSGNPIWPEHSKRLETEAETVFIPALLPML
jgi:gamma-glutamyltranspeptidase/glutathione hydrolase